MLENNPATRRHFVPRNHPNLHRAMNNSLPILSSLANPECHPAGLDANLLQEIPNTIHKSLARALAWGTPPNWSVHGWAEELRQTACLAALEALRDSPDTADVLLGAFVYQRVISKVRHHARREWRFALPLCIPAEQDTAPLEEEPSQRQHPTNTRSGVNSCSVSPSCPRTTETWSSDSFGSTPPNCRRQKLWA